MAPFALLPIAFYLRKRGNSSFDTSSKAEDADAQVAIRRWFVFATLKNLLLWWILGYDTDSIAGIAEHLQFGDGISRRCPLQVVGHQTTAE